jgi:hypothetical protein
MIRFLVRVFFRRWAYLLPFIGGFIGGLFLVRIAALILAGAGPLVSVVLLAWPVLLGVAATRTITPFLRRMFHE